MDQVTKKNRAGDHATGLLVGSPANRDSLVGYMEIQPRKNEEKRGGGGGEKLKPVVVGLMETGMAGSQVQGNR